MSRRDNAAVDYEAEDIVYRRSLVRCGHEGCCTQTLFTNSDQMRHIGWTWFSRGWKTYASGLTKEEFLYICPEHNPERGPSAVAAVIGTGLRDDSPARWDSVLGPDEWGI